MAQTIENVKLTASFTRQSNTTAYTAEDAVNDGTNNLSFTINKGSIAKGQSWLLKTLKVSTNNATITNGSFRLYIITDTQTAIADNAAQTLLYANRTKRVGYIDFTLDDGGTGSDCGEAVVTDVNLPFETTTTGIYGYIVAKAAYTPAAGETWTIEIVAHILSW